MKKIMTILLAFGTSACGPELIPLIAHKNESSMTLPSKVDTGDRFADDTMDEQEKASGVDSATDESFVVDSSIQPMTGSDEEKRAQLNQRILNNADYVVKKERHKIGIGDACNFYLQRVLELSGFSNAGYIANTFDQYALKRFRGYQTAQFTVEPLRKDTQKLENFLNSFPEGTPIILQWKKAVGHGHLAIVVRKNGQLIIYEASLGRFKAEKKLTNARTILSATDRYKLIAYVHFMPSDK